MISVGGLQYLIVVKSVISIFSWYYNGIVDNVIVVFWDITKTIS